MRVEVDDRHRAGDRVVEAGDGGEEDGVVPADDGSRSTVLRTGAVFRCRPDGSRMHAYSMGYRNPYRDVAFDTAPFVHLPDAGASIGNPWGADVVVKVAPPTAEVTM